MFIKGDVLKVRPEWLSEEEKKDPKYAEMEYCVRDCWDGKVEVICQSNTFIGYSIYTWPEYTMYKVGHISQEEIEKRIFKK